MRLVTGKKGEAHVTSMDDGILNNAMVGQSCFLKTGNKMAASIISSNEIRILDGEYLLQGRLIRIEPGEYETVAIDSGKTNYNRIDLIVMNYEKDSSTGIETASISVEKGEETTGTPSAPSVTEDDIRTGATSVQSVLYQVRLTGVNITSVTAKKNTSSDIYTLNTSVTTISSALAVSTGTITKSLSASSISRQSLRKYGKVVTLSILFNGISLSKSTATKIGSIPSGFRPNSNIDLYCYSSDGAIIHGYAGSDGNLTVVSTTAISDKTVIVSGSYIID